MTGWSNWGGNQHAQPTSVVRPSIEAQVVALLHEAAESGQRVKPVGSGHSFTGVAVPDGIQVDLSAMSGIVAVERPGPDGAGGSVRVLAGTRLHTFNAELAKLGLALPNLGDIDAQTVAGALSTGTHGTGLRLPGLAAGIIGLRIVLPDGSIRSVSDEVEPDLFDAARISLGALGIITEFTLRVVPAFLLHAVEQPEPLDRVLSAIDEEVTRNDHFEFYWFPHTDRTLTKRNNRVGPQTPRRPLPRWRAKLDDELLSNTAFEAINRLTRARPRFIPVVNQVSARAQSTREYLDASHSVFVTKRDVRFVESEFALPRAALEPAIADLRRWFDRSGARVSFPVEVRVAAADDVWLSTAYRRESCYLAVHQYWRVDHREYFEAFEAIALAHDGRPHWGKLHTRGRSDLLTSVPRLGDFIAVRDRVDPDRRMANDYTRRVLGD